MRHLNPNPNYANLVRAARSSQVEAHVMTIRHALSELLKWKQQEPELVPYTIDQLRTWLGGL